MAQKTLLVDDLNGDEAVETVIFGIDGDHFEIDLNAENAKDLRDAVAPWVEAGRKLPKSAVAGVPTRKSNTVSAKSGVDNKAVRLWAAENDIQLAERGRIPADIVERFKAETGK